MNRIEKLKNWFSRFKDWFNGITFGRCRICKKSLASKDDNRSKMLCKVHEAIQIWIVIKELEHEQKLNKYRYGFPGGEIHEQKKNN